MNSSDDNSCYFGGKVGEVLLLRVTLHIYDPVIGQAEEFAPCDL